MTPERFARLAQTYGGDIARWPSGEQADALALAESAAQRQALAQARALDDALLLYGVERPSQDLSRRVLAGAPRPIVRPAARRLWWAGAGLAGLSALGGAAGAIVVGLASGPGAEPSGLIYQTTAFGDVPFGQDG